MRHPFLFNLHASISGRSLWHCSGDSRRATAAAILFGAQLFGNIVDLIHFFQTWGIPVVCAYLVAFPVLVLAGAHIRGRGTLEPASSPPSA